MRRKEFFVGGYMFLCVVIFVMEVRFDGDGVMVEVACEEGFCGVVFVFLFW